MKTFFKLNIKTILVYIPLFLICNVNSMAEVPVITSFTPASGPTGSIVTISGTNFNATPENNIVFFGAMKAKVLTASSTSITVVVPTGATYQPISVTDFTTGLTAYSNIAFNTTYTAWGHFGWYLFGYKEDINTGDNPWDVAIGDFDNDGKSDVVVANFDTSTISIFHNSNKGNGISFANKVDFTTGTNPSSIAVSDLDGDGKLDIVVTNLGSSTVSVFKNTSTSGTISFADKIDFETSGGPRSVAIGDIDSDGRPDLCVASSPVSILRNISTNSEISFESKKDFSTGSNPISIDIGDIDGDKKLDLVVANFNFADINSAIVSVFQNTSTTNHISLTSYPSINISRPNYCLRGVSLCDLNFDNKLDLIIAAAPIIATNNPGIISVYKNTSTNSTISFTDYLSAYTTINRAPNKIVKGNIFGDGEVGVIVGSWSFNFFSVVNNEGTFLYNWDYPGKIPRSISIGDLDGDGRPDIAVANSGSSALSIFRNINGTTIRSFSPTSGTIGDEIIIKGVHLSEAKSVSLGEVPASSFTIVSDSCISATIGAGASGNISVASSYDTASFSGFTYKLNQTISFDAIPTKTYGDEDFNPNASSVSGLAIEYTISNPDVASVVDGKIHIVGAGECTIYADQKGDDNYKPAQQVSQTLVVVQKPIEVTVNANQKVYGESDPALTYSVNPSLLNNDTFSGELTRSEGENAGIYPIQQGALSAGNNYSITFQGADFTINKKSLNVKADNKSKNYGEANPEFTLSFNCFANDEDKSVIDALPTTTCAAVQSSNSGNYPIELSDGSDNNYDLVLENGTLQVNTILGAVSTSSIQNITSSAVDVYGELTSHGGEESIVRGFVYATTSNPTILNEKVEVGSGTGSFSQTINGLTPNTKYYVRSYATNSAGTVYGNELFFTTLTTSAPTQEISDVTIYPNPTSGIVYLKGVGPKAKVELYDSNGAYLKQLELKGDQVNLCQYKAGVYFIRITRENKNSTTIKVIKE